MKNIVLYVHALFDFVHSSVTAQSLKRHSVNGYGHEFLIDAEASNFVNVARRDVLDEPLEISELSRPLAAQVIAGTGYYLLKRRHARCLRCALRHKWSAIANPTVSIVSARLHDSFAAHRSMLRVANRLLSGGVHERQLGFHR